MSSLNPRQYLTIALLALCGYVGNVLTIPVTFGISFIFGSIFSIITAAAFGSGPGIIVSLIASSYTFQLWNHPYAIIIFICEIIWIAYFLRQNKENLLFIDLCYWLLVGIPLVFYFYSGVMELGIENGTLIALKQAINGILNAVLAWTLLSVLQLVPQRFLPLERKNMSSSQLILQLATLLLLVPSLGVLLLISQRDVKNVQENVAKSLRSDAITTATALSEWVEHHILAVSEVAGAASGLKTLVPSPELQEKLAAVHALFPDFHNVYIGDSNGTTIAFHPPQNAKGESTIGLNFGDRPYFKNLQTTLRPTVSNVFMGRGGIFLPTFTISVPVVHNGKLGHFGLGAINLEEMAEVLKKFTASSECFYTISDTNHKVMVSTHPHLKPMYEQKLFTDASRIEIIEDVKLVVPGHRKNISAMKAYRGAYYYVSMPIANTPWNLNVEYSVAPLQRHHYLGALWGLGTIMALLLIITLVTHYLSGYIIASLSSLGRVTMDLPHQIENHQEISWPRAYLEEVQQLIDNFKAAAASLAQNFSQTREINTKLEETVALRTEELLDERQRLSDVLSERNIILDNATVGISLVRNRIQIWENKALRRLFGYSSEAMRFIPTRTYYRNDAEYEQLGKEADKTFAAGLSYHTDTIMCRADGSEVMVSLYGKAINPQRPQDGSIWIFDDISARKEMERALRQSETRFRQLFHVASTPLLYIGKSGRILALNSKFTEVFGYNKVDIPTLDDWLEKAFPDLEYRKAAIVQWQKAKDQAENKQADIEVEYRLICKNGKERIMLVGGAAMEENFLATFIDITEIRKTNQALERAKETAEAANRTKSMFLSNMSHELRTPLNAILGFTQIFQADTTLSDKQQQGVQTIHKAAEHLLMIINDVLDMSKIEAGKLKLVENEVVLMAFLENIIDAFALAARKKSISLSLVADPSRLPRAIIADSLRLRQVIFNFMSNAMKFTEKGYCKLKVEAEPIAEDRYRMTIAVEDSGPGIPKKSHADIFLAFRQIEDHLQHESGTGLGLSISKQLVTLMGGSLELQSPVNHHPEGGMGAGSRFTVTFEAKAVLSPAPPSPPLSVKVSGSLSRGLKQPCRILVVDDNRSNRMVLREILEPIGFTITEAVDGIEVTEKCLQNLPDLILMDLRMPEMDGFTAFEQLSLHEKLKEIPVIAVTASLFDVAALKKKCLQFGFKDFILKPFKIDDLLRKIAAQLPISPGLCEGETEVAGEAAEILPPPTGELEKLRKLLAVGDIDSLTAAAETIAGLDGGQYTAFSTLLQQYADDFDFVSLDKLLSVEDEQ